MGISARSSKNEALTQGHRIWHVGLPQLIAQGRNITETHMRGFSFNPLFIYLHFIHISIWTVHIQKHTDTYKTFFTNIADRTGNFFFMSVINNGLIPKSTVMIIVLSAQQIWTQPANVSSGDFFSVIFLFFSILFLLFLFCKYFTHTCHSEQTVDTEHNHSQHHIRPEAYETRQHGGNCTMTCLYMKNFLFTAAKGSEPYLVDYAK